MKFYKREKPTVIYINVSRKWSEERLLSRGRSDDRSLSGITKRLNWFEEDTLPAIEYFRTNLLYRFIEVDGEQSIEKVYADIIAAYDH
jgi:adenylate kinase family enzyme